MVNDNIKFSMVALTVEEFDHLFELYEATKEFCILHEQHGTNIETKKLRDKIEFIDQDLERLDKESHSEPRAAE